MICMEKIKVVQCISSLHNGGAETLVKDIAISLNKELFDVTVITTAPPTTSNNEKELESANVRIVHTTRSRAFVDRVKGRLLRYYYLASALRQTNPDIIHCHLGTLKYIERLHRFGLIKSNVVFTVHCDLNRQLKVAGINTAIEHLLADGSLHITALHRKMQNELKQTFGEGDYPVINNGTNLEKYTIEPEITARLKSEFGIRDNDFVVGHVGRFVEVKNHIFLISVFEQIHKIQPHSKLLLVGDGELRENIQNLVKEKALGDAVKFLGLRGDIPAVLSTMDAFCLPSFTEGLPLTVVEAQAAGLRCVIADHIVDDVMLTDNIFKMSLSDGPELWAEKILGSDRNYNKRFNELTDFDFHNVITSLETYYTQLVKE